MSGGKWWLDAPEVSPLDVALQAEGVSGKLAELARSIYAQESSSGKNTATSNAGARGGMQILPGTFREVAEKGWNIDNPVDNARAGVRYLLKMAERAGGDPALGPEHLQGHGDVGVDDVQQQDQCHLRHLAQAADAGELAVQARGEWRDQQGQHQAHDRVPDRDGIVEQQPEAEHHRRQWQRRQPVPAPTLEGGADHVHGSLSVGAAARTCST